MGPQRTRIIAMSRFIRGDELRVFQGYDAVKRSYGHLLGMTARVKRMTLEA